MSTELVPVFAGEIAGCPVQLVDARLLHGFLEVVSKFADWIKNRIDDYGFLEDQDYVGVFLKNEKKPKGGRPAIDYHLTLDMAKELAMVERNEKGRQVRRYFIECERRAWSGIPNALHQLPETLTPSEQQGLQELVAYRATDWGEGKGKVIAEIWSRIHRKFRVAKYDQLPRTQLPDVTAYILGMDLRTPRPAIPATLPLFEGRPDSRVLVILHGNGRFTATSLTERHVLVDLDELLTLDRAMDAWRSFAQQRELSFYRVRTDPPAS